MPLRLRGLLSPRHYNISPVLEQKPYDENVSTVLVAWIGQTDLDCADGSRPGRGPIGSAVAERSFDGLVLLSNYTPAQNRAFVDWLAATDALPVHLRLETLDDPTDYGAIHAAAVRALDYARETFGADADLSIHISPGTPAMQAVWVLLAKTRYPAELIQSHAKTGVRTVSVPFDIAAEYVPALLREADGKLARLTAGLPPESPEFDRIIGRSPAMDRARTRARRIAPHDVTVLIEGESGTGKELFARAIHAESRRRRGPFEEVNCGALPEGLVESLLFGHVRGAFSGAVRRSRRRRHPVPRRDRRAPATRAGQDPPRAAGEDRPAARIGHVDLSRRSDRRRNQPRPARGSGGRPVPRGPLLPARDRCHPAPATP